MVSHVVRALLIATIIIVRRKNVKVSQIVIRIVVNKYIKVFNTVDAMEIRIILHREKYDYSSCYTINRLIYRIVKDIAALVVSWFI